MMREAIAAEIYKATPPLAVVGGSWATGFTISDAVGIGTLLYLVLQAIYLLWKWSREAKGK